MSDESSSEFFDPEHSESEDRFIRVGYSSVHRLLLVVFVNGRMATSSV